MKQNPNQDASMEEPIEKRGRCFAEPIAISGEIKIDDEGPMGDIFVEQVESFKDTISESATAQQVTDFNKIKQLLELFSVKIDSASTSSDAKIDMLGKRFDDLSLKIEKKFYQKLLCPLTYLLTTKGSQSSISVDQLTILCKASMLSFSRCDGHFTCDLCSPMQNEAAMPVKGARTWEFSIILQMTVNILKVKRYCLILFAT